MRFLSPTSLLCAALWGGLHVGAALAQAPFAGAVSPLIAGQNTVIGEVRCALDQRDDQRGSCEAKTTAGWCLALAHLYAGRMSPAGVAPGQFPFRTDPGTCVSALRVDFSLPSACVGEPMKLAFHAEARLPAGQQAETAWARGTSTGQNWSMVFDLPCRAVDN